eukprot:15246989-Alexandrium_andersonii.AAC.1
MADGGDESLRVARFVDTEAHDTSKAKNVLDEFRARVDFLFVQGNCVNLGFTKYAISLLSRQSFTFVVRGKAVT